MGQQLLAMYSEAEKLGLQAKMKLAMLTKVPSAKAGEVPDTPELVAQFKDALKRIQAGE
jgi:hypothetical protein